MSATLPPRYLRTARRWMERVLTDTCTICRYTVVSDAQGGQTETWPPDATPVACRLAPAQVRARGAAAGGQEALVQGYVARFAVATAPPGPRDRVLWQGRTFEVVSPGGQSWEILRDVQLVEAD